MAGRGNVNVTPTSASFEQTARRIRAFRMYLEQAEPALNAAQVIAEEIKTDVAASRPGGGVPRDTGALAASLEAAGSGRGMVGSATLSAGGAAAPYALVQHERMDFVHKVGEARYLVRGVERWRADGSAVQKALDANVRAAIAAVRAP